MLSEQDHPEYADLEANLKAAQARIDFTDAVPSQVAKASSSRSLPDIETLESTPVAPLIAAHDDFKAKPGADAGSASHPRVSKEEGERAKTARSFPTSARSRALAPQATTGILRPTAKQAAGQERQSEGEARDSRYRRWRRCSRRLIATEETGREVIQP